MNKINPEERSRMARQYFREGYNCSQSVVMAFSDILGITAGQAASFALGFGGGMGRLREVCGAFSGAAFISGTIEKDKKACYALVQDFAGKFREENGSIVCRDLLKLRADQHDSPVPSERTAEWYTTRPCERLVGCSARIVAEKLLDITSQE